MKHLHLLSCITLGSGNVKRFQIPVFRHFTVPGQSNGVSTEGTGIPNGRRTAEVEEVRGKCHEGNSVCFRSAED